MNIIRPEEVRKYLISPNRDNVITRYIRRLEDLLIQYSETPGQSDEYRAEAKACRHELGFSETSDEVSPNDLVPPIKAIKGNEVDISEPLEELSSLLDDLTDRASEVEGWHGVTLDRMARALKRAAEDIRKLTQPEPPLQEVSGTFLVTSYFNCPACKTTVRVPIKAEQNFDRDSLTNLAEQGGFWDIQGSVEVECGNCHTNFLATTSNPKKGHQNDPNPPY